MTIPLTVRKTRMDPKQQEIKINIRATPTLASLISCLPVSPAVIAYVKINIRKEIEAAKALGEYLYYKYMLTLQFNPQSGVTRSLR